MEKNSRKNLLSEKFGRFGQPDSDGFYIIVSILRAALAHPSYNFEKYPLLKNILTDPVLNQELIEKGKNDTDYFREDQTFPFSSGSPWKIFDKTLPFHFCQWKGDLPWDLDFIFNFEKNTNKPIVVAINAVLSPEFKKKWDGKVYELSAPWLSVYYEHVVNFENCNIEKDFACPINRLDANRQSWFYLLIRRGLLDRGFVSFNLDNSRSETNIKNLSKLEAFESLYKEYMLNFAEEHKFAKQIVPYRNFDEAEDLDSILMKSRFNIILETYSSFNDQIMFTEKTIRSLKLPRPWLLHGAMGSVAQLRKWGFDVLDDLVDHNYYDNVEHHIERQSKILDLAEEMCNFDIDANLDRLKLASVTNNNALSRWKNALPQVVFDDMYRILDDYTTRHPDLTK